MSQQVHDEISKQTRRDVQFLQKWGLMDYSLVVSYHGVPRTHLDVARSVYAGTSDGGSQPYLAASKDTLYISYVGIIDFLQDWTCAKKVAMCVKCCERNKATIPPVPYGDRFASFVDAKFSGDCAPVPEVVALDATP